MIAEDEPLAQEGLAEWGAPASRAELVGVRADGPAALQAIREFEPALVLMDIQMPGMTGLQVLRALAADPPPTEPAVIFTTAYDEHAVTAFELHAVDYLLKPFSQERFNDAVRHALQSGAFRERALPALTEAMQADSEPLTRVLVRDQGKIFPLKVDAIECLRSDTKYTALVSEATVTGPGADQRVEKRLNPSRFPEDQPRLHRQPRLVVAMVRTTARALDPAARTDAGHREPRVSRQLRADSL